MNNGNVKLEKLVNNTTKFRLLLSHVKRIYAGDVLLKQPIHLCDKILKKSPDIYDDKFISDFFSNINMEEQHFWIGNLYTNLISEDKRKELAAFFTPPYLSTYVINRLTTFGLNITSANILDPASGGAAFLSPLACNIIKSMKKDNISDEKVGKHILQHLSGIEIDFYLASISELMLNDVFVKLLPKCKVGFSNIIVNADSLVICFGNGNYDAVVSNPPYGRILSPDVEILERFSNIMTDKHVNKYALFMRLSLDCVKPGGYVALIVPTSFISGPYFGNLRKSLLEDSNILAIDLIDKRSDIFFDVLQDTCVIFMRKKDGISVRSKATCNLIFEDGTHSELGYIDIPDTPSGRLWVLPSELNPALPTDGFFSSSFSKLEDYGFGIKAGSFVWNREKHRYREDADALMMEYPLIWAHGVRANEPCRLGTHQKWGKPSPNISFVKFPLPSDCLIREPVIVLQRTSNKNQPRRLIAGYVSKAIIDKYGAVTTENHTIVVYPLPGREPLISLAILCELLNSEPVDSRFRQVSGTVSVSVKILRELPLPPPHLLIEKLKYGNGKFDETVEACYRLAVSK